MNITQLRIDGFGAWTDLRLPDFQPGLNVVYGPNEAGKTTLLEFLRSMLYGFSPQRRQRYLPPVRGGQAGGSLWLETSQGPVQVLRHDDEMAEDRVLGHLRLWDAEGHELEPSTLDRVLGGIDERTYRHVFAIGLSEIQELATLDDSTAAALLYNLSTGLDGIALADVMRDLADSRKRLLGAAGDDSQIRRLLNERNRLRRDIDALAALTPQYARAVAQREQLAREIVQLEEDAARHSQQVRLLETAVSLRDKWTRRAELELQLNLLHGAPRIPPGALERLDTILSRLRSRKRRIAKLSHERRDLREQGRSLKVDAALLRQAARIEALCDQQPWLAGLQRRQSELEQDSAEVDAQIELHRQRLNLDPHTAPESLRGLSTRALAPLKPLARALEESRRHLERVRQEDSQQRQSAAALAAKLETSLSDEPREELLEAVQEAAERVSQLRRRVQLDQRLEHMQAHKAELEDQAGDLLERQLLPLWVVVALGGVFVLGVVLILAGWWLSFGWAVAVLGVAGIVAAVLLKHHLEKAAEQQVQNNEKQLALLKRQIEQVKEEREALDEELPPGGGPLLTRLEKAEAELARLESLLPLDAQRRTTVVESSDAHRRLQDAEAAWQLSQERWQEALIACGLSEELSPQEVWQLAGRSRQLRELYRQRDRLQAELRQAEEAIQEFADRVAQLLADVGLMPEGDKPADWLRQLRSELAEQQALQAKRRDLALQDRRLRRRQNKLKAACRRLLRYRRRLFEQAGALDEADFRRRVAEYSHVAELRLARETVEREIAAALGTQYTEESLRRQFESIPPEKLEAEWEAAAQRLAQCEAGLKQRYQRRGELNHEIELLEGDRRLAELRFELGLVNQRLREASRQWQVRAVTSAVLESVREQYQRQRQPQTLRDASELFCDMTDGRYERVWTPMDEDRLLVDQREGQPLSVDVLSRGTREQLFLCLRLALVRHFARRGVRLPLVLDDVLVNFDTQRAATAGRVLAQFAEQGHQLLVFTCHEHMAQLLRSLGGLLIELPGRPRLRIDEPQPEPQPPRRKRRRRRMAAQTVTVSVPAEEDGFLADFPIPSVQAVAVNGPTLEVLEAEPVVEPPILIAEPLPEPPRAQPLVEEPPPLPASDWEAEFAEYDSLLPINREPAGNGHVYEQRPSPPLKVTPPVLRPVRPRLWLGLFDGNGAEEFKGEFATRPAYEE